MSKDADAARKALMKPQSIQQEIRREDMLSTGSTLLNLACTGTSYGGFLKGHYYSVVGDSSSGKTFLALTCFAEASINKNFKDFRLIYDDVEGGMLMSLERYFGKGVAERLESPAVDDAGAPIFSTTIEEFFFHADDAFTGETPVIYVLDSMDALSSDYEWKKFDERKTAARGGKEAKGNYGDGKAKANSEGIRKILSGLRETGSILIVISQTRDNIGAQPFQPTKVRSGGHALKFYAGLELWASVKSTLTRQVKGKKRAIGINAKIRVKKNRIQGKDRTVEVPIYHSMGIDDLGSCVDYLVDEGYWKKNRTGIITAPELELTGRQDLLVHQIEEGKMERDLRDLVAEVWDDVEKACVVVRKPRY